MENEFNELHAAHFDRASCRKVSKLQRSSSRLFCFFPQIAGRYRGSYFSMGCWSPKSPNGRDAAVAVSLHDLHSGLLLAAAVALSPFICLPSWSPFWAALGCRCRLVSLHLSPFMISILGCSWLPLSPSLTSFVSLHDLHSGLLLAAAVA